MSRREHYKKLNTFHIRKQNEKIKKIKNLFRDRLSLFAYKSTNAIIIYSDITKGKDRSKKKSKEREKERRKGANVD